MYVLWVEALCEIDVWRMSLPTPWCLSIPFVVLEFLNFLKIRCVSL